MQERQGITSDANGDFDRNLLKRGSMSDYILAKPQRFIVEPAPGWSDVTQEEVQQIISSPVQKYKFVPDIALENGVIGVSNCDFRQGLELVMRLATAHDVMWVASSKRLTSKGDWESLIDSSKILEVLPKDEAIQIAVRVSHPVIGTEKNVKDLLKQKLTDGKFQIADDRVSATQEVYVESLKNRTRVMLSMGGVPLYKRGYKKNMSHAVAPLAEHHAAAAFRWSISELGAGFEDEIRKQKVAIVVPFAGTGTLGFEALAQTNFICPSAFFRRFGFESWLGAPAATIATIRKRLQAKMSRDDVVLNFGEINQETFDGLNENIDSFFSNSTRGKNIGILKNDFLKNPMDLIPEGKQILFLLNPPYGLRLAKEVGASRIYSTLAKNLVQIGNDRKIAGYVLCPDEATWSIMSKSLKGFEVRTRHISHGGLDIRVLIFSSRGA
jgi:23S rRNA G2445 N2-methylase RlmL